jgi:hypothetical protein
LKKETILMAKEEAVPAMMPNEETVIATMSKSKVVTMVEMPKCTTARKIRCHPHAAVSSSNTLSSRGPDRCRQQSNDGC